MKTVAEAIGVSRSNLVEGLKQRPPRRIGRPPLPDEELGAQIKAGIPKPLITKDLLTAAAQVKPSTREWFSTARNYAIYSNQGGIYDDILKYMKLG